MADTSKTGTEIARRERAGSLFGEFDRLFDTLSRGFFVTPFEGGLLAGAGERMRGLSMPKTDVSENDTSFRMTVELPGMEEKNVEIAVSDGILTVRGKKEAERKEEKENYHLTEREYGSFERSMRLPPSVDQERIAASFDKGVLTIEMPKSVAAQKAAKKIPIGRK
jgi:HSP20 family protein